MNRIYEKSETGFSVLWIVIYVVGTSIADLASGTIGMIKSITMIFHILMSAAAFFWVCKNNLKFKYGLCKTEEDSRKFLYYIPLVIIVTCNLWFGAALNLSMLETLFYIVSMLCVGFLEELIFRGFLFKAMCRDGIKSAIIVSSVTFGIGHIVNLINGSGADLISNLCQVCYAIAFGFLFVIIFYKGKSLMPCIIAHSVINALSVFANEANMTQGKTIAVSIVLSAIAIIYTLIILKNYNTD